ncbi:MAG: hypothetical protein WCT37_05060 [Patescibacteria group bacterium]|jgi:hypothetical protein
MILLVSDKPIPQIGRQNFAAPGEELTILVAATTKDGSHPFGLAFYHPTTNELLTHPDLEKLIPGKLRANTLVWMTVKWLGERPVFTTKNR